MTIKNRLLWDIAHDLADKIDPNARVGCLEVRLYLEEEVVLIRDLPTTLEYLANDIHWDETGDWSDAKKATVREI